jgi:hypothetical protein
MNGASMSKQKKANPRGLALIHLEPAWLLGFR